MFKKLLITALLCPAAIFGQENLQKSSKKYDDIILNYKHLSIKQLNDTAKYYIEKNVIDTALIFYNLVISTPLKDADIEQQRLLIVALNNSAVIYYNMNDYRNAYKLLSKALELSENMSNKTYLTGIYNNMGNIYHRFKKYEMADMYYSMAFNLYSDSITSENLTSLCNLGFIKIESGQLDSAYLILNKALQIKKEYKDVHTSFILNNIALFYQKQNCYDSALYYFNLSLEIAHNNNAIENEAEILSDMGNFFVENNKTDSALIYFELSNAIASKNNFLTILAKNYLTLSGIEESKGNTKNAFDYFKKHTNVRDSLLNIEVFDDIHQIQRLYEVSKTNRQIEELVIEQQINERTIQYHNTIRRIIITVLIFVLGILAFISIQNRKLKRAYKVLFDKNVEIMNLLKTSPEPKEEKNKKYILNDKVQNELLDKILTVMEDKSIICDVTFSVDKLAALTQSNHKYVSDVIKTNLNKNFRSFLNSYRIREAQRLLTDLDVEKYTIETVSEQVGYKSRSSFYEAFKEFTGISPKFYLKTIRENKNEYKTQTENKNSII